MVRKDGIVSDDNDNKETVQWQLGETELDNDNNQKNTKSKNKLNKISKFPPESNNQSNTKKTRQTSRRTVQSLSEIELNKEISFNNQKTSYLREHFKIFAVRPAALPFSRLAFQPLGRAAARRLSCRSAALPRHNGLKHIAYVAAKRQTGMRAAERHHDRAAERQIG